MIEAREIAALFALAVIVLIGLDMLLQVHATTWAFQVYVSPWL